MSEYHDRCDCNTIRESVFNRVRAALPGEDNLYDLADLFKVFGDSTRVKILAPWASPRY